MVLTRVLNDAAATAAGAAQSTEKADVSVDADATNGGQDRKVIFDQQGEVGGFGRASDGVQTYAFTYSPNGVKRYIVVDNSNNVTASDTQP